MCGENMKKFTLLELLVVVAIIGILASLLLPSLSNARLKVKQAVCLSNGKQIATATITYMSGSDNKAPHDNITSDNKKWFNHLIPDFLPEGNINNGPSPVQKCPVGLELTQGWMSNIAMNSFITGKDQDGWTISRRPTYGVSMSDTALLMDSYLQWRSQSPGNFTEFTLNEEPGGGKIARHFKKVNVTFLDGHGVAKSAAYMMARKNANDTFWDPQQ